MSVEEEEIELTAEVRFGFSFYHIVYLEISHNYNFFHTKMRH